MWRVLIAGVCLCLVLPSATLGADGDQAHPRQCRDGWTAAPQTWTERLPDGGQLHHYQLDGDTIVPEPPAGFRPFVATDDVLERYGFPPRPRGGAELAVWTEDMKAWRPTPNRALCITDRAFGGMRAPFVATANFVPLEDRRWSGYAADESVNTYIAVQGDFVQKAFSATSCVNAEMGAWVGIGGYTTGSLIQTGTAMYRSGGVARYYAWFEFLDAAHENPAVEVPAVDVNPGDRIHLYTVHQRSTGKTTFYIANNTNGTQKSIIKTLASSYYDGKSAEHIVEAPLSNYWNHPNSATNLANFGNLNWTNTKVQLLSGDWVSLGSRAPDQLISKHYYDDGSSVITADPDAMSSNTTFTNRWKDCDHTGT